MWEFLGSILSGGVTGLLGVVLSFASDYFKARQRNAQEITLLIEQRKIIELEIASAERVEIVRADAAREVAESSAFAASIAADRAAYSRGESPWLVLVDVVRGLVRPSVTLYLCALISVLYFATESPALRHEIQSTSLYLATAAVLWWFGSRAGKRA